MREKGLLSKCESISIDGFAKSVTWSGINFIANSVAFCANLTNFDIKHVQTNSTNQLNPNQASLVLSTIINNLGNHCRNLTNLDLSENRMNLDELIKSSILEHGKCFSKLQNLISWRCYEGYLRSQSYKLSKN